MRIRTLVAAAALAVSSLGLAAPAHAWECNKNEVCHGATMTVCMTIFRVTGEQSCM